MHYLQRLSQGKQMPSWRVSLSPIIVDEHAGEDAVEAGCDPLDRNRARGITRNRHTHQEGEVDARFRSKQSHPEEPCPGLRLLRAKCTYSNVHNGSLNGKMFAKILGWKCGLVNFWRSMKIRCLCELADRARGHLERAYKNSTGCSTLSRCTKKVRGLRNTCMFYCRGFKDLYLRRIHLFDDNIGDVVIVFFLELLPGSLWNRLTTANYRKGQIPLQYHTEMYGASRKEITLT